MQLPLLLTGLPCITTVAIFHLRTPLISWCGMYVLVGAQVFKTLKMFVTDMAAICKLITRFVNSGMFKEVV